MSFQQAIKRAFMLAEYYNEKYYVWGFQSARSNKWCYTVTNYQPEFMMHLEHIT